MANWYATFHKADSKVTLHKMKGNDDSENAFVARCQRKAKQLGLVKDVHVIRVGSKPNSPHHFYPVK
jgi:hypothetical protein